MLLLPTLLPLSSTFSSQKTSQLSQPLGPTGFLLKPTVAPKNIWWENKESQTLRAKRDLRNHLSSPGQQTHEKMLHISNHQGNAKQNHNEMSPHTSQNGHYPKDKYQVLARMWTKGSPPTLLVALSNGATTVKSSMEVP